MICALRRIGIVDPKVDLGSTFRVESPTPKKEAAHARLGEHWLRPATLLVTATFMGAITAALLYYVLGWHLSLLKSPTGRGIGLPTKLSEDAVS